MRLSDDELVGCNPANGGTTEAGERWTDLACLLLNVPRDDQRDLEAAFRKIKRNVARHWNRKGHNNMVVMSFGPPQRSAGLVALAHKNVDKGGRDHHIQCGIDEARMLSGSERVVVISRDLNHKTDSYSAIMCAHPKDIPLALGNLLDAQ